LDIVLLRHERNPEGDIQHLFSPDPVPCPQILILKAHDRVIAPEVGDELISDVPFDVRNFLKQLPDLLAGFLPVSATFLGATELTSLVTQVFRDRHAIGNHHPVGKDKLLVKAGIETNRAPVGLERRLLSLRLRLIGDHVEKIISVAFQELSVGQFRPGGNLGQISHPEPRGKFLEFDTVCFSVELIGDPRLL
jgi:hypothetical protein